MFIFINILFLSFKVIGIVQVRSEAQVYKFVFETVMLDNFDCNNVYHNCVLDINNNKYLNYKLSPQCLILKKSIMCLAQEKFSNSNCNYGSIREKVGQSKVHLDNSIRNCMKKFPFYEDHIIYVGFMNGSNKTFNKFCSLIVLVFIYFINKILI